MRQLLDLIADPGDARFALAAGMAFFTILVVVVHLLGRHGPSPAGSRRRRNLAVFWGGWVLSVLLATVLVTGLGLGVEYLVRSYGITQGVLSDMRREWFYPLVDLPDAAIVAGISESQAAVQAALLGLLTSIALLPLSWLVSGASRWTPESERVAHDDERVRFVHVRSPFSPDTTQSPEARGYLWRFDRRSRGWFLALVVGLGLALVLSGPFLAFGGRSVVFPAYIWTVGFAFELGLVLLMVSIGEVFRPPLAESPETEPDLPEASFSHEEWARRMGEAGVRVEHLGLDAPVYPEINAVGEIPFTDSTLTEMVDWFIDRNLLGRHDRDIIRHLCGDEDPFKEKTRPESNPESARALCIATPNGSNKSECLFASGTYLAHVKGWTTLFLYPDSAIARFQMERFNRILRDRGQGLSPDLACMVDDIGSNPRHGLVFGDLRWLSRELLNTPKAYAGLLDRLRLVALEDIDHLSVGALANARFQVRRLDRLLRRRKREVDYVVTMSSVPGNEAALDQFVSRLIGRLPLVFWQRKSQSRPIHYYRLQSLKEVKREYRDRPYPVPIQCADRSLATPASTWLSAVAHLGNVDRALLPRDGERRKAGEESFQALQEDARVAVLALDADNTIKGLEQTLFLGVSPRVEAEDRICLLVPGDAPVARLYWRNPVPAFLRHDRMAFSRRILLPPGSAALFERNIWRVLVEEGANDDEIRQIFPSSTPGSTEVDAAIQQLLRTRNIERVERRRLVHSELEQGSEYRAVIGQFLPGSETSSTASTEYVDLIGPGGEILDSVDLVRVPIVCYPGRILVIGNERFAVGSLRDRQLFLTPMQKELRTDRLSDRKFQATSTGGVPTWEQVSMTGCCIAYMVASGEYEERYTGHVEEEVMGLEVHPQYKRVQGALQSTNKQHFTKFETRSLIVHLQSVDSVSPDALRCIAEVVQQVLPVLTNCGPDDLAVLPMAPKRSLAKSLQGQDSRRRISPVGLETIDTGSETPTRIVGGAERDWSSTPASESVVPFLGIVDLYPGSLGMLADFNEDLLLAVLSESSWLLAEDVESLLASYFFLRLRKPDEGDDEFRIRMSSAVHEARTALEPYRAWAVEVVPDLPEPLPV